MSVIGGAIAFSVDIQGKAILSQKSTGSSLRIGFYTPGPGSQDLSLYNELTSDGSHTDLKPYATGVEFSTLGSQPYRRLDNPYYISYFDGTETKTLAITDIGAIYGETCLFFPGAFESHFNDSQTEGWEKVPSGATFSETTAPNNNNSNNNNNNSTNNPMATIKIKRKTTTGGNAPTALGEISCNTADKELFVGDGAAAIKFIDTVAVDSKISTALTSAFTYKGSIAGNGQASTATAASATALAASPKNGDYYKITTAGFVKKNGAADTASFFVNIDDSVVYNGTGWDKIDNTNSGVTAEAGGDLAVTGSTDAGFVVGFSSTAALDQSTQSVDGGTY